MTRRYMHATLFFDACSIVTDGASHRHPHPWVVTQLRVSAGFAPSHGDQDCGGSPHARPDAGVCPLVAVPCVLVDVA
jgi:hypothetical protein